MNLGKAEVPVSGGCRGKRQTGQKCQDKIDEIEKIETTRQKRQGREEKMDKMDKTRKTEEKIQRVLDEKINGRLADHGGSAELTGFEDGIASVKFYGACGHCASADDTFQFIVKSSILEEVPEVREVVLDETVSEDLLEMARKILNGELK